MVGAGARVVGVVNVAEDAAAVLDAVGPTGHRSVDTICWRVADDARLLQPLFDTALLLEVFDVNQDLRRLPTLVMGAAVLTFFSFVGFEDMLNVGEEVKDPTRTMPKGILLALLITTVIYISMSITAVSVVPLLSPTNSETFFAAIRTMRTSSAVL